MKRPLVYPSAEAFLSAGQKRIAFVAMSGLGKTYTANRLREGGNWYHYSVDYRIGTRYMGEHIVDNFKREAMKVPFLAELLMDDAIYIANNITFENLAPLSSYLGKPGSAEKGGIPFAEYMRRQEQHRQAEVAATLDTLPFIERARNVYGYDHFICDTSGSICEVVDPSDPGDPVLTALASNLLIVWIEGKDDHVETLCERFDAAPKPMYARAPAMTARWNAYLDDTGKAEAEVDPDAFIRWSYRKIIEDRQPIYREIAANWGVSIKASDLQGTGSCEEIFECIAGGIAASS